MPNVESTQPQYDWLSGSIRIFYKHNMIPVGFTFISALLFSYFLNQNASIFYLLFGVVVLNIVRLSESIVRSFGMCEPEMVL